MSITDPIDRNSDLGRLLDADRVPALPEGFADAIVARTQDRAPPLPETRSERGATRRWRSAQRIAVTALGAGALATAAAATGALESLGISLPPAEKVWATLTGTSDEADGEEAAPLGSTAASGDATPTLAPKTRGFGPFEGLIDTPEKLEEAFERFERAREERKEARRSNVDQRVEQVIERRRARGLPAPTPAQEERIRNRIERFRERRDAASDARIEERREALREKIENGEEITADDLRPRGGGREGNAERPQIRERIERLRELPPEERREQLQQWREQRQERRNRRNAQPTPDAQEQTIEVQPEADSTNDNPPSP